MTFQKCLQHKIILVVRLSLTLGVLTIASPAQSGGFELDANGNSQGSSTEVNTVDQQKPESQRRSLSLNWQQWEPPYQEGDAICRERHGNIVCLTTESANNLHWQ